MKKVWHLYYRINKSPDLIFYINERLPVNLFFKSQRNKKIKDVTWFKQEFANSKLSTSITLAAIEDISSQQSAYKYTIDDNMEPHKNYTFFLKQKLLKKSNLKQTTSHKILSIAEFTQSFTGTGYSQKLKGPHLAYYRS